MGLHDVCSHFTEVSGILPWKCPQFMGEDFRIPPGRRPKDNETSAKKSMFGGDFSILRKGGTFRTQGIEKSEKKRMYINKK